MKWSKETPTKEGWYWMKRKSVFPSVFPCRVTILKVSKTTVVHGFRNETFFEGPHHGGKGLTQNGVLCKGIWFGDEITEPEP